ncbi:hypothetical protein SteCoe_13095 [Stentor coeruleus]|uniref:RING-type domain-containing protein n=1 Tax=Stentor coeruleus TaxID=5963 RepID=A0A1R2C956_9CILI|nr:hypothetical protein SteCoe_13095 [Stentor coeruleus]
MKVIKKKFRALGSAYNLRPKCNSCEQVLKKNKAYDMICNDCFMLESFDRPLASFDSYHNISYACEDCPKEKCILCGGVCEDNLSLSVNAILDFVELKCYFHSNAIACYFDPETFLTYCDECYNNGCCLNSTSLDSYNFYLENIGKFRDLYVKYKKSICPERRKSLIPYTSQEVLDGIRFLIQIERVRCEKHWEAGVYFDENFNCYCDKCTVSSEYSIPINNENAFSYLEYFIKNHSKTLSFECINKFILKLINRKLTYIPKGCLISLSILEGKKLLCNPDKSCQRCVSCFAKASTEKTRPIILQCNHIMCLKCVRLKSAEKCPIEDTKLDEQMILINKKTKETLKIIDMLSDTKDLQYKCSCSHVISQKDALYAEGCLDCLFPYDYFLDYSYQSLENPTDKDKIIEQKILYIENLKIDIKRLEDKIDKDKEDYEKCLKKIVSERVKWDEERRKFLLEAIIYKNNIIKAQEENFLLDADLQDKIKTNKKLSYEVDDLKAKMQKLNDEITNLSNENLILNETITNQKTVLENQKQTIDEYANKNIILYKNYTETDIKLKDITKTQDHEKIKLDKIYCFHNNIRLLINDLGIKMKMNFVCFENCKNCAKYICLSHDNHNCYLCQDHGDKHLETNHQIKLLLKSNDAELNAYAKKIQEYKKKTAYFFSNSINEIEKLYIEVNKSLDKMLEGIMIMKSKGIPRDFDLQKICVFDDLFEKSNLVRWLLDYFKKKL